MKQFKWAIVGTGHIANRFAKGMAVVENAVLHAVVSRDAARGQEFAEQYGGSTVYTDYNEMLDKAKPDIVYIALPNDCHYAYIMAALDRGIHVLSEKPMADNAQQLNAILDKAKEKDVFLMEGMWTRCFPAVRQARQWIADGRIGDVLSVHADFNIKPLYEEWQPWKGGIAHAGGSLRDVGIYSLAMAYLAFPQGPENSYSTMKFNGEVDESFHMLLTYGDGKAAFLGGAFNQISNPVAEITGEFGRITLGTEFWHPTYAELLLNNGSRQKFEDDFPASGFQYEIMEVQDCLEKGLKESPCFTWDDTRKIAALIESTRKEWGIIYQADKETEDKA